jgi:hypothetical protein
LVIAGLVPAISMSLEPLCPLDRDGRNKSGHDVAVTMNFGFAPAGAL